MSSPFDERLQKTLDRLHEAARGDHERWIARTTSSDSLVRLGEFYLATAPAEGRLLYMLARMSGATSIVEFGASYGVSTLYLAAAAREQAGHVTTTEVHPDKCTALRSTFAESELDGHITLLEGDARETLATHEGSVDFLFLDGWKSMYLPVLELLDAQLDTGAVVVADNWSHEAAEGYRQHVTTDPKWLTETMGDLAISYAL